MASKERQEARPDGFGNASAADINVGGGHERHFGRIVHQAQKGVPTAKPDQADFKHVFLLPSWKCLGAGTQMAHVSSCLVTVHDNREDQHDA